jgi:hypothetical protein
MTEFWFDSNFFIAAREARQIPLLKRLFAQLRTTHQFYMTKRIKSELFFFNDTINLYFKVMTVENSTEFKRFCTSVRYCLKNSKSFNEPADQSLAFAAAQSDNDNFLVTNDEGFKGAKRIKQRFMSNVCVIEPMEFLEFVIPELSDKNLIRELEKLIIHYADHFIKHRLKDQRPIENILENLLLYNTIKDSLVSIQTLPDDLRILLKRFIANEILTSQEERSIVLIKRYLLPFVPVYSENDAQKRSLLTKSLYLQIPELLSELREEAKDSQKKIYKFHEGIEELIERELFRLRITETIHYFQDCLFEEAYLHFSPLLETNWCFPLKIQTLQNLKLLYGIFQLSFGNFSYINHLMDVGFWKETSEVKQTFNLLLEIKNGKISNNINEYLEDDLSLLYNLGLFFCNTGNIFGLQLFDVLFELTIENLENLDWRKDFLKRYVLELRINQREVSEEMKTKFLNFLQKKDLENNTLVKFDRNSEVPELTAIEDTNFLFKQPFYLMRAEEQEEYNKTYCWSDGIRSIVSIIIPKRIYSNLKNVKSIQILSGNIKTKKPSPKEKKNARIFIELDENCELNLERFKLNILSSNT